MIKLRPALPTDFDFLYLLKKKTLKKYIEATWGWDEEFQYAYHQRNFDPSKISIIQDDDNDIGCLFIFEDSQRIFLEVIEIAPEYQNQGIGRRLIQDLILRGRGSGKNVELQVLKVNHRAQKLYAALGFQLAGESKTHFHLVFKVR
ncbi:MAG: GNAT family N-acetyltransferase [Candidatus Heimdallarchaeota archaeon]